MDNEHWMARQGDVVITAHVYNINDELVPVTTVSSQAVGVPRDAELGIVLQAGAVTHHHHAIPGTRAALMREPDGARRLLVGDVELLEHDEHDAIEIPSGIFAIGIQVEYVPGALPRQVED